MKNKNFNNNTFSKKWFYLAIACGLVFALITTFIAIGRNMSYSKKRNKSIPTQAEKTDLKKEPSFDKQIYSSSSSSSSNFSSYGSSSSSSSSSYSSSLNSDSSSSKSSTDLAKPESKPTIAKETKLEKDKDSEKKESKKKQSKKDKEDSDSEIIKPTQAIKKDVLKDTKKLNTKFLTPIKGEILRPFSKGELVHWGCLNDWRTHDGIDVEALKNTPVKAIADGTVTAIVDDKDTWGNCITITHSDGKFKSIYKGLSNALNVKENQTVKAGDVIGTLGDTNKIECDLKNHLHFGLKKQEQENEWVWVNPQEYIDFK